MARFFVLVFGLVMLSACAHEVRIGQAPALGVQGSYEGKVPGTFALLVHTAGARGVARMQGLNCSAWNYEMDFADSFKASVRRTFEPLLGGVVMVNVPVSAEDMKRLGYRGVITVTPGSFVGLIRAEPGLFISMTYADVRFSAEIVVEGPEGRLVGNRANGNGTSQSNSGFVCEGGATSLGLAAEKATSQLLRELAESVVNEPRLREPAETAPAPAS